MKWLRAFSVTTALAALTFSGVACEKKEESPVEQAGEATGQGLKNIGEALEKAGENVQDATKDKDN